MSNYPYHMVGANLPRFKKPPAPTNYYGCDPYNTFDAPTMRQRVMAGYMK